MKLAALFTAIYFTAIYGAFNFVVSVDAMAKELDRVHWTQNKMADPMTRGIICKEGVKGK